MGNFRTGRITKSNPHFRELHNYLILRLTTLHKTSITHQAVCSLFILECKQYMQPLIFLKGNKSLAFIITSSAVENNPRYVLFNESEQ